MLDILKDPKRSFNCDESFVLLDPGKQQVLAAKGTKDVYDDEWTSKRPQNQVTIKNIAHLLHDVWQKLPLKYGQNGFRACGLYPWDPKAVR